MQSLSSQTHTRVLIHGTSHVRLPARHFHSFDRFRGASVTASVRLLYLAGSERLLPDSATELTAASEGAGLGALPLTAAGPTNGGSQ
jgi:hypothetical protein